MAGSLRSRRRRGGPGAGAKRKVIVMISPTRAVIGSTSTETADGAGSGSTGGTEGAAGGVSHALDTRTASVRRDTRRATLLCSSVIVGYFHDGIDLLIHHGNQPMVASTRCSPLARLTAADRPAFRAELPNSRHRRPAQHPRVLAGVKTLRCRSGSAHAPDGQLPGDA